jgi:hypothetical protein
MSEVKYPEITVKLIGENGNAFNLIGITANAIKAKEGRDAANSFASEAMEQGSYDELLAFMKRTVNVR